MRFCSKTLEGWDATLAKKMRERDSGGGGRMFFRNVSFPTLVWDEGGSWGNDKKNQAVVPRHPSHPPPNV